MTSDLNRNKKERVTGQQRGILFEILVAVAVFVAFPIAIQLKLWQTIWEGSLSHAWDGPGHQAIAQIYTQSIFPDTFGWTHTYFGGMPFPNFYPPLFYSSRAIRVPTGRDH